jgi:hypothetical protein
MQIPDDIERKLTSATDRYLDLAGLAEYSTIGKSTLRVYIRSQGLPAFKIKGKTIVKKSEFDRWMEEYRIKDPPDIDFSERIDQIVKENQADSG